MTPLKDAVRAMALALLLVLLVLAALAVMAGVVWVAGKTVPVGP